MFGKRLFIFLFCCAFSFAALVTRAEQEGGLYYIATNGVAIITGCDPSYSGPLVIPSTLGGCPEIVIDSFAFSGCSGLTSVTIPGSVDSIGDGTFEGCSSLASVDIQNGVTSIGDYAFCSCIALTSVTIPGSVGSIGDSAFYSCTALTTVTIPGSVYYIGWYAFEACSLLTEFVVDSSNASYASADGVLFDKDFTTLIMCPDGKTGAYKVPSGVIYIDYAAFDSCNALTAVTIPSSVASIGEWAFISCSALTDIVVDPLNATYASADGVLFDKKYTTLILCPAGKIGSYSVPEGVTSIGDYAFYFCSALTSVSISGSVTIIGDWAFDSCTSLTAFVVDAANTSYASADGVLFNKDLTLLIQYPGGKAGAYEVPAGVTIISGLAFISCTALTSVTIPASVTGVDYWSFLFCSSLTNIVVDPSNVAYASADGVLFDKNYTTLILYPAGKTGAYSVPVGVISIGYGAFDSCTALTSVTVPGSVASIGYGAFFSCTALNAVLFQGNAPMFDEDVFTDSPATIFHLPSTFGWNAVELSAPILCWDPSLQPGAAVGFSSGRFAFNIVGSANIPVRVEAAADLASPVWISVTNASLSAAGALTVRDPDSAVYPSRFYRVVFPE